MDITDLLSSIELYKMQLDQVNIALESAEDRNKNELKELQLNLIQVLELTLSQIDQIEKNVTIPNAAQTDSQLKKCNNTLDAELELFKHEISLLENTKGSKSSTGTGNKKARNINKSTTGKKKAGNINDVLRKELEELEGQEVQAPFVEQWGGHSYHNAVVLSVYTNEDGTPDVTLPRVLVLYSQPTCLSMLPCRYFLEDKCTFNNNSCKFSHGEEVLVTDLKEYIPPDKSTIVEGSKVLALHNSEDIWHKGTVLDILPKRTAFSFDCIICKEVVEVKIEQIIPLCSDQQDPDEMKETLRTVSPGPLYNENKESIRVISPDNWLNSSDSCKLGNWEQYTKGIGSKLMAQMGYVIGTGLGVRGDGRIDPVPAYAFPQGISLDRCRELRLKSNGEDYYLVEKRLLKEQRKEAERQKKHEENLNKKKSVFDIINHRLGGNASTSTLSTGPDDKITLNVNKKVLKNNSAKELNRKNCTLSSRITQTHNEISRLLTAKERQSKDIFTVKSLDKRLVEMRKELSTLQDAERNVQHEQQKRRDVKKLVAF